MILYAYQDPISLAETRVRTLLYWRMSLYFSNMSSRRERKRTLPLTVTGTKTANATTNLSGLLPVATMTEDNDAKLRDEQPRTLFFCPVNETFKLGNVVHTKIRPKSKI